MDVYEVYSTAAGAAALSHGVPAACVGVSPWASFFELLHRTVMERHDIEAPHTVLADLYFDPYVQTIPQKITLTRGSASTTVSATTSGAGLRTLERI